MIETGSWRQRPPLVSLAAAIPGRRRALRASPRAPARPTSRRRPATTSAAGRGRTASRQGQHTRLHAPRARAGARRAQGRPRLGRPLHGPRRDGQAHRRRARQDRGFSEQQHPHLGVAHALRARAATGTSRRSTPPRPACRPSTDPLSFFAPRSPLRPADPQLYRFLRGADHAPRSRRADDDLAPAAAAWGSERIAGLTRNRSLEAHLANHGIERAQGEGRPSRWIPTAATCTRSTPPSTCCASTRSCAGARRPAAPAVASRSARGRRSPTTAPSPSRRSSTTTSDHHASAMRVFEAARAPSAAVCRRGQEVVNVYGNSNEGDMSAGLDRHGPAASDYVGRVEADAMLRAWRAAGRRLVAHAGAGPALDAGLLLRAGDRGRGRSPTHVARSALPFFTGSEEERGPLFDITRHRRSRTRARRVRQRPARATRSVIARERRRRRAVPLMAVRVGRRLIVSVPGEGTKEVGARHPRGGRLGGRRVGRRRRRRLGLGQRVRPVLHDARGVRPPALRRRQHALRPRCLVEPDLGAAREAGRRARRAASPRRRPYPFDPTNGVTRRRRGRTPMARARPRSSGAARAARYPRLERATLELARRAARASTARSTRRSSIAERRERNRWVRADDDLGLAMLWKVDAQRSLHARVGDPARRHARGPLSLRHRGQALPPGVDASSRWKTRTALELVRRDAPAGTHCGGAPLPRRRSAMST